MLLDINNHTILLWVTGIAILSFDLVVYFGSKNRSSRIFAFYSSFVALWSISYGFIVASLSIELSLFLIKINHVLGIITSLGFVYFSLTYPNDEKPRKIISLYLFIIGIIFFIAFFFTDLMIPNMFKLTSPDKWGWFIGKLYYTYCITFNTLWLIVLVNIYRKIKCDVNSSVRLNQLFMFWGLAIGIFPPAIFNIILPFFGIYGLSWIGPIISAVWIFIIGYSIIRYRQMNVKVVITEVLAIAMTMIFFINIFTETPVGVWDNIATFLVFLILATYLIRGVLLESKQKEELRDLNENLESKVAEQTIEIRKAYELEKKARRDLEKLNETKDQFIMITQHHLRTPVNNIQTKIKSILTDGVERSESEIRTILQEAGTHTERLVKIVNDFLSITTIKSGGNILKLSKTNPKLLIEDILLELKIDIEQKDLTITYPKDENSWPIVNVDSSKIRDALLIIIENAIKYNNTKGKVIIETISSDKTLHITITDTGIGINKTDQEKIFSNLFTRGGEAKKLNPVGMGIGLSVAKAIIKAHHGDLAIKSNKENIGTAVIISIPIDYTNHL